MTKDNPTIVKIGNRFHDKDGSALVVTAMHYDIYLEWFVVELQYTSGPHKGHFWMLEEVKEIKWFVENHTRFQ